jgi:L-lactate dehydrogenase complex protein LldG
VTWEVAESPVVARLTLVTRLREEGVKQVLTWAAHQLPINGVLEALEVLGIEPVIPALPTPDTRLRPQDLDLRRRYLLGIEAIPVGLTGADAALAVTGTLLLNSGPGRPLLVSQLPRRHIVLLPASRLYPSLERWLAGLPRVPGRQTTPVAIQSFLTGPSRSADIEATPAFGIHGPSRLHVILVQGR